MDHPIEVAISGQHPPWTQGPVQVLLERVLAAAGPKWKPEGVLTIDVPAEIKALPADAIAIVASSSTNMFVDRPSVRVAFFGSHPKAKALVAEG